MVSFLRYAFMFMLMLGVAACDSNSDNDNDNNNIPGGSGTMRADIDGATWSAANATATRISAGGFSTLTIAGADTGAKAMTVSFVGVTGPGTYTFGSNNLASMSWLPDASGNAYLATAGSATITTINDDEVKGTFSFEGLRISDGATISITNGSFDVGYGISPF